MVGLKWLQSILTNRPENAQAAAGQSAEEIKKKEEKKTASVDLANAALVDKAEDLEDLITAGYSLIKRKRLKKQVREKVAQVIADEFNDPEIIDEITERIADAAEIDPYYKNLFGQDTD